MKKIYSVILLIAYLVGTIQPAMPMFKYQLNHDGAIESILLEVAQNNYSVGLAPLSVNSNDSNKTKSKAFNLLRDGFYPVGFAVFTAHEPVPYLNKKLLYSVVDTQTSDPTYFPNSPPPKFS